MRRAATYGLIALIALAVCSVSQAAIMAQFTGTTPQGSNTSYNYNLIFSTNNGLDRLESGSNILNPGALNSADFITLYDVATAGPGGNLVSAGSGAGWGVFTQNLGINAAQTSPIDDPLRTNVTFQYTGPTISTDTIFGGFNIVVSNNDGTTLKQFTGQYTDNDGPEIGTKIGQIGMVAVPAGTSIPEPATVGLSVMAALGLVARRRRV